jgi:hypothetical protein
MLLCLLVSPVVYAEIPPLMHVDDIQAGMKGIGKTVFSGTTIEEFDVEILGVLKNQSPHGDVIMAKISGGSLPIEKIGIIGGMSGSPIYIDGKLIGALATGQIFPKEPMIAGITPIHEMLDDANRVVPDMTTTSNTGVSISDFANSFPRPFNSVSIQTPLLVSGGDQRLLAFMQEHLAAFNMFPAQGGAVSQGIAQNADTDLQPGSSIGIQLIRGDMDVSAIGTVTYRDDNEKIIAFGHPMFYAGNIQIPMTAAYVHFVSSNQIFPYKVASPLDIVGTITQDRRTGISGILGPSPRMIPLNITVQHDGEQAVVKEYSFEVIDHPVFIPLLMNFAGLDALLATESVLGDATIRTHSTIRLKDQPPLIMEEMFTGNQNTLASVSNVFNPLSLLMNNSFTPVSLEEVSLDITIKDAIQSAEIVGVRIQNNVVRPGEVVEATISLRPYGEEELITVTERIAIPEDLQRGKIQLLICDVNITNLFESARASAKFQPQNLDQLIELLGEQISQNHIVMSLLQLKPGMVVQGQELPSPPVSMMTLMGTTKRYAGRSNLTRGQILLRKEIPTQYIVSGCAVLELTVNHSDKGTDVVDTDESAKPIQGERLP